MLLGLRGLPRRCLRLQRQLPVLRSREGAQQPEERLRQDRSQGHRMAEPLGLGSANVQLFWNSLHTLHHVRLYSLQQNTGHNGQRKGTLLRPLGWRAQLLFHVIYHTS